MIWVVWNPSINLTIHSKSIHMMTCLVQLPNSTDEEVVSYIYRLNCKYGRQHLWEEIKCMARDPIIHGKPWAALGDFNQVMNPTEISSGSSRISSGIADFREYVEYSGLFDLSIRGSEFTWWNKQVVSPIAKNLDRILINDLWQLKFPTSFAKSK
ncbi:hypothetical protein N665_0339s0035 [Sinapis alba]|nr:hypothetical protein N665_0339s0035 [Sinapis alba]